MTVLNTPVIINNEWVSRRKKCECAYINVWSLPYLKLGLSSAAEFGQDGEQRLVNCILC